MLGKSLLATVARDQLKEFEGLASAVPRERLLSLAAFSGSAAFVIKGIRRCGKSTLLKQLAVPKFKGDFYYINFDDERLYGFAMEDFQKLMEVFSEEFGKKSNVLFDEIQNVKGWELFVNRLLREGLHIFITGSNASLLSKELGTHLTGRHIDIELYPFSFSEFLTAKGVKYGHIGYSTEEKALIVKSFKEYFTIGGMPEVVMLGNQQILIQLLGDIVQRDIANRYSIRKPNELKAVIRFLMANIGNVITYRSINENFGIMSANTLQKYIEYIEETYLIFTVKRYDPKLKRFDKNPRKVYCIDNGMVVKNVPQVAERGGSLLENLVAVHLKETCKEFYYFNYKGTAEADFILPRENEVIQVCYELNEGNKARELKGLIAASKAIGATALLIITFDQEAELVEGEVKIRVMPLWKWLLAGA